MKMREPMSERMDKLAWKIASHVGFIAKYDVTDPDIDGLMIKGRAWQRAIAVLRRSQMKTILDAQTTTGAKKAAERS